MNNPTRNGKIARLPKAIREAINQRLDGGATAKSLVGWLNELPEVQALVQSEFEGHPIREQNLSQWKKGGYREWVRCQEALALAEHLYEQGAELRAQGKTADRPPLNEMLTLWLTSQYMLSTRDIERAPKAEAWKLQRQMCTDVMKLRRAEQQAERLHLDRERMELRHEELAFKRECAERKHPGVDRAATAETKPTKKTGPENEARNESQKAQPAPARPSPDSLAVGKIARAHHPENRESVGESTDAQEAERIRQIFGIPREKFVYPGDRSAAA